MNDRERNMIIRDEGLTDREYSKAESVIRPTELRKLNADAATAVFGA